MNTGTNTVVPIIRLVVAFIMSPVIVHALGNYDYGVWEIVFSLIGYMGILDLGLQPAITRYVAKYAAQNKIEELKEIYSTALVFMSCMGVLVFILLMGVVLFLPEKLSPNTEVTQRYIYFLLIVSTMTFVTFSGSVFDCYLEGLQKYSIKNLITVIFLVVGNIFAYYLLRDGGGLLTLALVNAIGLSFKTVVYGIILSRAKNGGFRFQKKYVRFKSLKELFLFGYKSLIQAIALRISTNTDVVVIGAMLGPATVTFYAVPAHLIEHVRSLIWSMTRPFMPLFSELHSADKKEKVAEVLQTGSRYVVGIAAPVLIGICFIGPSFLGRWIGLEYMEKGRLIIYILAAAYFLTFINPFSGRMLTGIGRPGTLAAVTSISALANIVLTLILVHFFGKEGAAAGTLIAALFFEPVLLHYTCVSAGIRIQQYARSVLAPLLAPNILLCVFLAYVTQHIDLGAYFNIIAVTFASAALYGLAFYAMSITKDEKKLIMVKTRALLKNAVA